MTWIDEWRADEDAALSWLRHLGGEHPAADVAAHMQSTEERTWHALTRLVWRGLAEYGSPYPATTWKARERGGRTR